MSTTNATLEEDNEESSDCDTNWCDGQTNEVLPCFACFDPDREYLTYRSEHQRENLLEARNESRTKDKDDEVTT